MREDAWVLVGLMSKATRTEPGMWGSSIVGFDSHRYRYASGREGDWPLAGFAPQAVKDVHLPTLRELVQQSVRHMVAVDGRQPRD
jgi:hypothetical protein